MRANEVWLITGASSGIGLALARKVVAAGGRVALVARNARRLEEIRRELGPDRAAAFPLDVTDLTALERLPARVVERLGSLDVLVNDAGRNVRRPMTEIPAQDLAAIVTTNLTAPVVLCRAAAPLMPAGASIVSVASLAGMVPVHHESAYSASKAGLRAFSRVIAGELAERGIHVGVVSPGPVDTGFLGDLASVPPLVLSQPMSTPEEVADVVLRCVRERRGEIAVPWLSGILSTLGYLSPTLTRALRPLLERRGEQARARLLAARGATPGSMGAGARPPRPGP